MNGYLLMCTYERHLNTELAEAQHVGHTSDLGKVTLTRSRCRSRMEANDTCTLYTAFLYFCI